MMVEGKKDFSFAGCPWHELGWYLEDQLKAKGAFELSNGVSLVYLTKHLDGKRAEFIEFVKQWQTSTNTREPRNNFDIPSWLWFKRENNESKDDVFDKFTILTAIVTLDHTFRHDYSRLYYINSGSSVVFDYAYKKGEDRYIHIVQPFDSYRIRTYESFNQVKERFSKSMALPKNSNIIEGLKVFSLAERTPLSTRRLGHVIKTLNTVFSLSTDDKGKLADKASALAASRKLHREDAIKRVVQKAYQIRGEAAEQDLSLDVWTKDGDDFELLVEAECATKDIIKSMLDDLP